jgi:hypothetical protein
MYDNCPNCEQCDCNPNDFDDGLIPDRNIGSEEEAHYWWTIKEFENLLKTHGARKVFGDLGTDFIIKITKELSSE